MKIKYDQPKGHRVNKGSCKVKGYEHRAPMFLGLETIEDVDNSWWCDDLNK